MQKILLLLLYIYSFSASASDTVLKFYRPFGEVIEQMAPVMKHQLKGQCETQSQLILREDAWRCRVKNKIFDPCFVKEAGAHKKTLCPQSPWTVESVQISVPNILNNKHHAILDMSRAYPWAIELTSGERCLAMEPTKYFESMPIRFRCDQHRFLIGPLQRCKSVWSMLAKTPDGVVTVEISKAWF